MLPPMIPATDRLRWGILGTGNIAGQFATGVAASQRGVMTAVASRQLSSAIPFARIHAIAAAYGTYDELLNDPAINAVYISLPNSMHFEWTIKALRAGKHVLCEKPIAVTVAEAEEMFDVSRRQGRALVEAFMYRSHPQTLAVMQAVRSGVIGELKLIRTSFCFRTTRIAGNIRFDPQLAGGGLMDVGCYCINFSRCFAGDEPTSVSVSARLHTSGVDDLAVGTMTFPNGILASFTCGMTTQADNTACLCGDEGFIEIPVPWKPPRDAASFIIARGTPPKMDGIAKAPAAPQPPPRELVRVPVHGELYGIEADDFAAVVLDNLPPRISRQDSIGNMRVLEEMRRQVQVSRI